MLQPNNLDRRFQQVDSNPIPAERGPGADRPRRLPRCLIPFAVDAKGLTYFLPFGLRTIRTMDAAGKLPAPLRIGGRVVWRTAEIRAWLNAGAPDRQTWAAMRDARKKNRP